MADIDVGAPATRGQAEQLKVPIVSEDRFNLLIRYYDPRPQR